MAIYTDRSVFYHVPCTGGTWVKEAMRQSGLRYNRCRGIKSRTDDHIWLRREHATPDAVIEEHKAGRFSFCFVRHPVSWLKSYWCYRVKTDNFDMAFPPDQVWDDDFQTFVLKLIEQHPNGFITKLYQCYVGQDCNEVDFIGRQENLRSDLITALETASESFDSGVIQTLHRYNVSASGRKLKTMCVLDSRTEQLVLDTEKWVLDTFYRVGE